MTMLMRTTYVATVRTVGMPRGAAVAVPRAANAETFIQDGSRHKAIGSFQALGLAIAASALVTGLLWVVL